MHQNRKKISGQVPIATRDSLLSNPQLSEKHPLEIQMIVKSHSLLDKEKLLIREEKIFRQSEQSDSSEQSEDDEKYSIKISQRHLALNKKKLIVQNHINSGPEPFDKNYDIRDVTYTMITSNLPLILTVAIFVILVVIRYYTLLILIDIASTSDNQHLLWLIVVIGDRVIYFILVVKISLKSPETKTEITLKSHWNSKESERDELFEVIDFSKLKKSMIRGLIPAEFSFLYINASPRKKFQIYAAINYIYASIQSIIYFPFFLGYLSYFANDSQHNKLDYFFNSFTIGASAIAEFIMCTLTVFLLMLGHKRKYGHIFCWKNN